MNEALPGDPCELSTRDGEIPLLDGSVLSEAEKETRWDRALEFLAAAIADSIAEEIVGAAGLEHMGGRSSRPDHDDGAG